MRVIVIVHKFLVLLILVIIVDCWGIVLLGCVRQVEVEDHDPSLTEITSQSLLIKIPFVGFFYGDSSNKSFSLSWLNVWGAKTHIFSID